MSLHVPGFLCPLKLRSLNPERLSAGYPMGTGRPITETSSGVYFQPTERAQ